MNPPRRIYGKRDTQLVEECAALGVDWGQFWAQRRSA
jgi:hypothetical protein